MPKAIFINPDGSVVDVDVPVGMSLMQAATNHGITGIVGDCGGALTCATCHIFVAEAYLAKLPPPSPTEDQMLDFAAAGRAPNSRFSCQVVMDDSLDGISVEVAEPQF